MPKISIVTPCFNTEKYIGKTIESVQSQTLTDWEHIVVDDGSSDRSAEIIQPYSASDPRIRLIQQPNGGVCKARNAGFAAASQESDYLLFLDADDCLNPEMLETLVSYLDQHLEVGLVYCSHTNIDANDQLIEQVIFSNRYLPTRFGLRAVPDSCPETLFPSILASGVKPSVSLIRRSVYDQTPGWDEALGQHYEDTDLFLDIVLRSECHYFPEPLARYRQHPQQASISSKTHGQGGKFHHKWMTLKELTNEQKALYIASHRFSYGRVTPHRGWIWGNHHLKKGEVSLALRYYLGALRRYVWSLLPQ
ncbi:glycosyltransferase family 2 protein [Phormidesmis priestleyi]